MTKSKFDAPYHPLCEWQSIGVGTAPIDEQFKEFKDGDWANLLLIFSKLYGYAPGNLGWIEDQPLIEGVWIQSIYQDMELLSSLSNLRVYWDKVEKSPSIQLKCFSSLEHLSVNYLKGHPDYSSFVKLRSMNVGALPKKYRDFEFLSSPALESVSIIKSKLVDFSGIEKLNKLRSLRVFSSNSLLSKSDILFPADLRVFELYGCKNFDKLDSLASAKKLEYVDLTGCGEIESLEALRGHQNLERIYLEKTTLLHKPDKSLIESWPKLCEADRLYLESI